jgi:hypothetical protein
MSYLRKGVVKLEYLLTELIVLLVRILNLADSVSDRPSDLFNFLLGILVLAIGLYELLPKVVNLFLKERSIRPLLIIGVTICSLSSIVVLG